MHTHTTREDGNAVTLTLLGLAVAILAGVTVLYFVGKSVPQPEPYPSAQEQATTTAETPEIPDPRAGWNTYLNDAHEFSLMYPPGWIVATGTVLGVPVVTVYDAAQPVGTSTFGIHELPVRVSFYPEGLPTGGKGEQKERSRTIITVPEASALDYVLGSGTPWATAVTFGKRPASWSESGFAFARVAIEEEELAYMRGDTGISPDEFDPFSGDTLVTYGYVDSAQWNTVSEVLRSFMFTAGDGWSVDGGDERIQVVSPMSGASVASPLLVKGSAHGSWYFEASFPVRLVAADGTVLAEVPATALDDWMQDAFVPFEVSLVFTSGTATSGTLYLMRDNPSGLPEHDVSIAVPVLFGGIDGQ